MTEGPARDEDSTDPSARDLQGRIVSAEHLTRRVTRHEADGSVTVIANSFGGKRLLRPNDVIVKSNGAIYFSDSVNGLRGGPIGPDRQLPFNGFFLVKDGYIIICCCVKMH